jgi:hypothetical protein
MLHSIILVDPTASLTVKPEANTHVVEVLEGEKIIKVEQIRQLVRWLGQHGFEQGSKRAVVLQAQRWHADAPHILLKALEEPATNTDIVLTTDSPSSMLPTIRSRCATFLVDQLSDDQLLAWGIVRRQAVDTDIPQGWMEFSSQPAAERWSMVEAWLKNKYNPAILFGAWQQQILQQPVTTNQAIERVRLLGILDQALRYLQANVSPRLVFDYVLLTME